MSLNAITNRVAQPSPEEVKAARELASITQKEAAQLISGAKVKPHIVWQAYEAPVGSKNHRKMPLACWELFLLLTNQHPRYKLTNKE